MSKNSRIIESWNANAEAWIQTVQNKKIESREKTTNEAIINAISDYQPHNMLDMGCGEGWLCRAIYEKGIRTVGIDGSQQLIDEANKYDGTYYCLTYEQFKENPRFLNEMFDVIVFNFSLLKKKLKIY
ncbi:class I SAM-dependent methyltransferase [Bacillaceae bacterium W0354]